MRIAVYPGSFDPMTLGHLDIISRISPMFDKVIVVVPRSSQKKPLFLPEERVQIITECTSHLNNIEVEATELLTVDFAFEKKAIVLIRGLRTMTDFDTESVLANVNRKLSRGIETLFILASPEYSYISSTIVREAALYNADLSKLVPTPVAEALKRRKHD